MAARRVRTTTRVQVSSDRGVFMISVAAELADMHPQTLRMYEARGLIEPKRSPKGTRLYSQEDVDRLRRIQEMTAELGMNLAGVERVFELEEQLESLQRKVATLEKRARELDVGIGGGVSGDDLGARGELAIGAVGADQARELLVNLGRAVGAVTGIRRIRFTSPHPNDFTDRVVEALADVPAVCEHVHLPMQSGSDRIG